MSEVKFKFKVICYLQGYSSFTVDVHDGTWELTDRIYTVSVKSGLDGRDPISNKTYRFPVESTVIEENK